MCEKAIQRSSLPWALFILAHHRVFPLPLRALKTNVHLHWILTASLAAKDTYMPQIGSNSSSLIWFITIILAFYLCVIKIFKLLGQSLDLWFDLTIAVYKRSPCNLCNWNKFALQNGLQFHKCEMHKKAQDCNCC